MSPRSIRAALLALTASTVACAPATFENIMGGVQEKAPDAPGAQKGIDPHANDVVVDPTLKAPRPISPVSVTWVNTLRPRFTWELSEGSTGAVVELSRSRDFAGEVRRFNGTGTQLDVPDDLPQGIWFWRLRGRNAGAEGPPDAKAIVWEVLVRGPSAPGKASSAPNGSVVDVDGDGVPDLNLTFMAKGATDADPIEPNGVTLLGHPDGTFTLDEQSGVWFLANATDIPIAAGIDMDGDGFTDIVTAGLFPDENNPNEKYGQILLWHGGVDGFNLEKDDSYYHYVAGPVFNTGLPSLQAAGDINGDGFGDISAVLPNLGFTSLGSPNGSATMMVFAADEDPKVAGAALASSCDVDGDGLSDVVIASTIASSPIRYTHGKRDRLDRLATITLGDIGTPSRASAITSGDFDGSGQVSVAFATVIANEPYICIYGTGPVLADSCWKGPGTAENVAQSLAAGDLDGDGKDEIVIAMNTGITVLKREEKAFTPTSIPGSFGSRIGMIHPGRGGISPGGADWEKAVWAVYGADGKSVNIFKGMTLNQKLDVVGHAYLVSLGPSIR